MYDARFNLFLTTNFTDRDTVSVDMEGNDFIVIVQISTRSDHIIYKR